ncbi:MAG: hypothetical protein M0Z61_14175 [Nitrospiraceae bacterium]|nr:hypothetical protein [Nitrospiraceae bacterium]
MKKEPDRKIKQLAHQLLIQVLTGLEIEKTPKKRQAKKPLAGSNV